MYDFSVQMTIMESTYPRLLKLQFSSKKIMTTLLTISLFSYWTSSVLWSLTVSTLIVRPKNWGVLTKGDDVFISEPDYIKNICDKKKTDYLRVESIQSVYICLHLLKRIMEVSRLNKNFTIHRKNTSDSVLCIFSYSKF